MTRAGAARHVYPHREDSELLLPFARVPPATRLAEIGCGEGRAALEAARHGARVVATDLNPDALAGVARRAAAEGLRLEAVRTDLLNGLGRFDRILSNPPYLPTPAGARDPDRWVDLALDGGPDGWAVTARLLSTLPEHLTADGEAFVLVSSRQETQRRTALRAEWTGSGGALGIVASSTFDGETLEVWRLTLEVRRLAQT